MAMMNSRLSMNGVVPMMSPVTGSRSGATGRHGEQQDQGQEPEERRTSA